MEFFRNFIRVLTKKELKLFLYTGIIVVLAFIVRSTIAIEEHSIFVAVEGGSFTEGVVGQPILINPVFSENQVDRDISALLFASLEDLALYIDKNEKNNVFTVSLKENLFWSDGAPITSDDIIFTIQTIQTPNARSPLENIWKSAAIERISQLQVRITIPEQNVFFENTVRNLRIIPKHIYGEIPPENIRLSTYAFEPVGSGPYVFEKFSKKKNGFITKYILERNKKYSGKVPYIDQFRFYFYENEDALENAFRIREIDGFGTQSIINTDVFSSMKSLVFSIPTTRHYALFFNTANEILSNTSLRTALVESVSKEAIAHDILFGKNDQLIKDPSLEPDREPLYNPEHARNIVEKEKQKIILKVVVPDVPFLKETADIIKKSWESIGVETKEVILDPRNIIENAIKTNDYDAILFGNTLQNTQDLFPFWHSSQRGYPGLNLSLYKNTKVDALIEAIRKEPRNEKRQEMVSLANAYISNDTPALFLFSVPYTYIVRNNIGGISGVLGTSIKPIADPSERFAKVNLWSVSQARIFK